MRKMICLPSNLIPTQLEEGVRYISAYTNPRKENVGYFGINLHKEIRKAGFSPPEKIWDFNTIALSVAAADNSFSRQKSPDGWTRQIHLTIHLCNPDIWEPVRSKLEKLLKFLTGDFWEIAFLDGGSPPPVAKMLTSNDSNCVCLLSGGVDSLAGAIDLVEEKSRPIFVSHVVRGDAETQRYYARKIREQSPHFQWSSNINPKGESEGSTRGRSIVFFAFAALAASSLNSTHLNHVDIIVPENGFISLNIPLNPGRIGSFSTKTTHPSYLNGIQSIWDEVGINLKLKMPFQFKTKGEVLLECKNQALLSDLVFRSVSCGKYRVYKMQHCGRCVPCLVRRAAFHKWGKNDETVGGYFAAHFERINTGNPDDVGAVAAACTLVDQKGINRLISGGLSFCTSDVRDSFISVVSRGLGELRVLLQDKVKS